MTRRPATLTLKSCTARAACTGSSRSGPFKSNAEIVIGSLCRSVSASVKVSQNAVAASCAQALHRLYNHVEDKSQVLRDAETFFGDPSSPIYRQVSMEVIEHEGRSGFFARRAGCCLVWRTRGDNGYCSNCILQSREEQTRQFTEMLEGINLREADGTRMNA